MSKIEGENGSANSGMGPEKRADSTEAAVEGISNFSLEPNGFGGKADSLHPAVPHGPSLLTQQAPYDAADTRSGSRHAPIFHLAEDSMDLPDVQPSSSMMSVDSEMSRDTEGSSSSAMDGLEKITVKIADLGNGEN